jgi:hypothetical protein
VHHTFLPFFCFLFVLSTLGVAIKGATSFSSPKEKSGLLEMMQTGLIQRVITALGLDEGYAKGKHTQAESKP